MTYYLERSVKLIIALVLSKCSVQCEFCDGFGYLKIEGFLPWKGLRRHCDKV